MSDLYDRDFYAWANEQADLLRAGNLSRADIANIAEEIETLGRSEKRELVSRLTILLQRLLKWRFQPERRSGSWELSVANARDELTDHLGDNPSLKTMLPEALAASYRRARRGAELETGLPGDIFPVECPWTFEQAMSGEPIGSEDE
jgi:predicted  nucleic acid-binding Zn-ribbon protein